MGIYWPLEEQMLAAGGEVLLERLPAAGRGSSRQREWRLAEGSGKRLGRQRYFWRRQSLGKGRKGRFRELQRMIVQLRGGEVLLGREIEKKNTGEKNRGREKHQREKQRSRPLEIFLEGGACSVTGRKQRVEGEFFRGEKGDRGRRKDSQGPSSWIPYQFLSVCFSVLFLLILR